MKDEGGRVKKAGGRQIEGRKKAQRHKGDIQKAGIMERVPCVLYPNGIVGL
jgi:hypothetical protein